MSTSTIIKSLILIAFIVLFIFPTPTSAQTAPTISNITDTGSTPVYDKFEITFDITTTATNPFFPYEATSPAPGIDPAKDTYNGITVDVEFTPDNWGTIYKVPAFYFQNFDNNYSDANRSSDWIYPKDEYNWKARFSPNTDGTWRYRIIVTDSSGTIASTEDSFSATTSQNKGFVSVSNNDPRYFEFSNGDLFTSLGYNDTANYIGQTNTIKKVQNIFPSLNQDGVQMLRFWLTPWSIYGAGWQPWRSHLGNYLNGGYMPASPLSTDLADLANEQEFSFKLEKTNTPCIFFGWENSNPSLVVNQNYKVGIRYRIDAMGAPIDSSNPYGLTVKEGNWLWNNTTKECDGGNLISGYEIQSNTDWQTSEWTYNFGNTDSLPDLYMSLDNVNSATVYIGEIWVREELAGGGLGPNIIYKPSPDYHTYVDQRGSFVFDKVLDEAQINNIFLKTVLLEKNDYIFNKIDANGNFNFAFGNANFYASPNTKVRWLHKAWWRYVQARWGYSTNIHTWELLNEGTDANGPHWTQADAFTRYMHCEVFGLDSYQNESMDYANGVYSSDCKGNPQANGHMSITSFDKGFQYWFWKGYNGFSQTLTAPYADFANQHFYISPATNSTLGGYFTDIAKANYDLGMLRGAYKDPVTGLVNSSSANKPVIRGETALIRSSGSGPVEPYIPCYDQEGLWLHNFLWSGLGPGGIENHVWYIPEIITVVGKSFDCDRDNSTPPVPVSDYDIRPLYKTYLNFISTLPLNNGNYTDAQAQSSNANVRAWGQIDGVNERAHLWIQNKANNWNDKTNFVRNNPGQTYVASSEDTTITIGGFAPNTTYTLEWWDTFIGQPSSTNTLQSDASGDLQISINSLTTDTAVKIGDYSSIPPSSPTPTPIQGDANGDRLVDGIDYIIWLNNYNQNTPNGPADGDFNSSGKVDGVDYVVWLNNYSL